METPDIRWKQRFQNFEKAILQLKSALESPTLSELEKAGVIQYYGFTFELAWKTAKDYLEYNGLEVKFPRDTIKIGFEYGIIQNGEVWLDMLQKRNLMSHTYDSSTANVALELIQSTYFEILFDFYNHLKSEL